MVQTGSNKMMNILLAVIAVILAVGIYAGLEKVDTYLKFKAMADCGLISKFEISIPTDNTVVSYPVEDVYRKCLDEKGY